MEGEGKQMRNNYHSKFLGMQQSIFYVQTTLSLLFNNQNDILNSTIKNWL